MRKIKIVTDSCSDLKKSIREKYDIDYLQMFTVRDAKETPASLDWEYYSPKDLYDTIRDGNRVTTTQVPAVNFENGFKKFLDEGFDIVYIACSSKLSGSVNTGRKVAIVASGDLSHKLREYGPYGFEPEGPEYDARIMDVMGRASFGELLDFDSRFCEKAAECGHRSFVIMAGVFDGMSVKSSMLSHQDVTGVGYGICTFYPEAADDSRHFLDKKLSEIEDELRTSREDSDEYVKLARDAIEAYVSRDITIDVPEGLPKEMTDNMAGAFVSIHKMGELRGCIGTISPTKVSVAKEIIDNGISAATKDPRFPEITKDELPWLDISVDVLGRPEDIDSRDELDIKRYGVIVSSGYKRGLLLPDLDGIESVDQQIDIARRKAGIGEDEEYTLQRFEVIRHH